MNKAEKCIRATVAKHNLIKKGDHIVIGLSGGPDSVCLFHVLLMLAKEMDLTIYPVHLNHKMRSEGAERDQKYVEELCERLGVPEKSVVIDCNRLAEELGMTTEEAGRKARYDTFFNMAEEIRAGLCEEAPETDRGIIYDNIKIAVAQNAEDQAETILFRLLRGTGTDGLAGIAYEREERRGRIGYRIIRPLLDTKREDIEAYCRAHQLKPVIDHTNSEAIYARNKIRLELLPYLEENYNVNIKDGLTRLGRIARADKEFLWRETEERYRALAAETGDKDPKPSDGEYAIEEVVLQREGLAACHDAIRHRIMLKAFGDIGLEKDITAERLEAADEIIGKKQGPKTVEFPQGYRITVAGGLVRFRHE